MITLLVIPKLEVLLRCILCMGFNFTLICASCRAQFLQTSIQKRLVAEDFYVYSFYAYEEIEELILTKYSLIGSQIYKILAQLSFKEFAKDLEFDTKVYSLAIDDKVDRGYSHTAILNSFLKSGSIEPLFGKLRAQNRIQYASKSYAYRLKHKRNFIYSGEKGIDVILVDDVITTGLTMQEAYWRLKEEKVTPKFGLTLANAMIRK